MRLAAATLFSAAAAAMFSAVLMFFAGCSASDGTTKNAPVKPHIVLILADDMGFDSVSANNEQMGSL